MSRESDLLFGLLALQMNFLSKEHLLEAAAVWMGDPSGDLPRLLLQRRCVTAAQHSVVKALVEEQIKLHDGDAGRSLAAAPPPETIRDALLTMKPAEELRKSLAAARPRETRAPTVIMAPPSQGRYRLGAEIGRGGLGRVVEAFDAWLERDVAVKLVLDDIPPDLAERFEREAKLTGRLDHPHIVPIYDFGTLTESTDKGGTGKKLFLSMKRIRGRDLGKLLADLAEGGAEARQVHSRARLLRIFQDICLGMAFAHDHGVIHRDLKPDNIMIGDYGETLIVDWGLARVIGALQGKAAASGSLPRTGGSVKLTLDGELLGTPAYMSPEQASGRGHEMDHRSDLYSLGAILYEILTLAPPFDGTTAQEILTKVRNGKIEPPSVRVAAKPSPDPAPRKGPSSQVSPLPIPPELDAICLKAMAYGRQDRYQSAKELHDEIQLFLEGVKDRERKAREAKERVEAGLKWLARFREMRDEVDAQDRVVREWGEKIKPHQTPEEKRPLWDAEAQLRALGEERINAVSRASAEFAQALTVDPGSTEASDGMCDLFLDRFLEAEAQRNREGMLLNRNTLATHDREGKYAARLDAPGTLAVRAFAYACDCLRPVRHPEWRVEIAETVTIPWRDGRPRPDLPPRDKDRLVPAVRLFPEGTTWGHTASCIRREVPGVEVSIARYEERDKRLVPGPARHLGRTPLADIELPRGSWLCTLSHPDFAEVRLPVKMERNGEWSQDVNLFRPEEIPPGFCFVPGGPFEFGGRWAGGGEAVSRMSQDFFVARFATTCAEYQEFLNDLSAREELERARSHQPRDGERKLWIEKGGIFRLPSREEDPKMEWAPDWPVLSISWLDAIAYCAWRSRRDGRIYGLLHEEEFEKAARGVDGRIFPYGDEYDGSYSHTSISIPEKITPMPVDSFPVDESPCGVRGLSGGMVTWCSNALEHPHRDWRSLRGGAWGRPSYYSHAGNRQGYQPGHVYTANGLRLAARPRTV